jgi:hypothetical protein
MADLEPQPEPKLTRWPRLALLANRLLAITIAVGGNDSDEPAPEGAGTGLTPAPVETPDEAHILVGEAFAQAAQDDNDAPAIAAAAEAGPGVLNEVQRSEAALKDYKKTVQEKRDNTVNKAEEKMKKQLQPSNLDKVVQAREHRHQMTVDSKALLATRHITQGHAAKEMRTDQGQLSNFFNRPFDFFNPSTKLEQKLDDWIKEHTPS